MMLLALINDKDLDSTGDFGDYSRNQRRFAPTLPHFSGIVAPLQRNAQVAHARKLIDDNESAQAVAAGYSVSRATLYRGLAG